MRVAVRHDRSAGAGPAPTSVAPVSIVSADSLVAANWDSLVFDIDEPHLKRVPMMEPLLGTKEAVGALLDGVGNADELLQAWKVEP
jgi:hypothetical protein